MRNTIIEHLKKNGDATLSSLRQAHVLGATVKGGQTTTVTYSDEALEFYDELDKLVESGEVVRRDFYGLELYELAEGALD